MKTIVTLICLFFFVSNISAQDRVCNCPDNLSKTIQKTEENYAGYPAKVTAATANSYKQLVQQLRKKAAATNDPKTCFYVLREYVRFFKDKHFGLSYRDRGDFDSTVVAYQEEYFKNGFAKKTLHPLEGIWTNPDSSARIAIQKINNTTFRGIRIESKSDKFPEGFVYFTLTLKGKQLYVKEYNSFASIDFLAKQNGNLLQFWNYALWGRVYPQTMNIAEQKELATWKNNNNGLDFRKLNSEFSYLKIPTFQNNDDKIQQLISRNDSVIRNTKYLIVDLTGNGGGNTGWIYFLPYFMTNTINQESSLLRVTPDNVKNKLPDLEPFVNNPIPDEYKKYFPDNVLNAYKKTYRELPDTKKIFYPIPGVSFPLDSIMRMPEKIALVVDNFCGSSAEYFFNLSRQSKKTIRYGINTTGMMDYEGMPIPTSLPYDKFNLVIPIAKSSWTDKKPIDQTGFTPDVIINLPQSQWNGFIMKDLPKR